MKINDSPLKMWSRIGSRATYGLAIFELGGKYDDLIDLHGWKEALVVYSEAEAAERGLEIDHDDSHAAFGSENFALLIHGTQPKGSHASQALQLIKRQQKELALAA